MTGLDRISAAFSSAHAENRAALMPYCTLGFPHPDVSPAIIQAIATYGGADLIELGVPFSDPLADRPTIQHSTQVALKEGSTTSRCLKIASGLRLAGVRQPLLLMGYCNPILAYGVEKYTVDAASAGVDGLIVPDLPLEEAADLEKACRANGLALVYLVSPNTSPERLRLVARRSSGFLYLVSVTGTTGARREVAANLESFIAQVRQATSLPLAVGFGISTPQQACAVGQLADGVIVGSALIDAIARTGDPVQNAANFVISLRQGLQKTNHC